MLLILAGVSIATLAGDNGVLTKASDAKIVNAMGSLKDEVNLKAAEAVSEYYENIYVHKKDEGATVIRKYASIGEISEITRIGADLIVPTPQIHLTDEEILENITNSKVYDQQALVWYIIYRLAEEFTNGNVTGTEISRNSDLTIAIKRIERGTSITGTVTIKSKAVPSLKTVGTVQADGAIKWGDTFKRTTSSGGNASERLKEILNDDDLYDEAEEAGTLAYLGDNEDYEYYEYEGEYYKAIIEDINEEPWTICSNVTKLTIDKTRFGVQDGVLVTPSTPENLIHPNYEGPNTYQYIYYLKANGNDLDLSRTVNEPVYITHSNSDDYIYDENGNLLSARKTDGLESISGVYYVNTDTPLTEGYRDTRWRHWNSEGVLVDVSLRLNPDPGAGYTEI